MQTTNTELLREDAESPYVAYSYSYPHKTAYRELERPRSLADAWKDERRDALFLYMHIPFCEMRCGFCNLFTTTSTGGNLIESYLGALRRQSEQVAAALDAANFARFAVGGGTPTFLDAKELDQLLDISSEVFNVDCHVIPTSIETSPLTATPDKLRILRDRGVSRISIGVQSFDEKEVRSIGRPQQTAHVVQALENIRNAGVPTLNIDIIYGIPEQTMASFKRSLDNALAFQPEEIYLYPLYIRPLTGLGRSHAGAPENRLSLYRFGRDYLLSKGYKQISMRMFQAPHAPSAADGPIYCCQTDGMVGVGCGARSYTTDLHYASEYAVSAKPVRSIIERYVETETSDFAFASYGFVLDDDERKRRFVLQTLLQIDGLSLADYRSHFSGDRADCDFPTLNQLVERGLAFKLDDTIRLTAEGLELSDQLGVEFYSPTVKRSMVEYSLS